MTNREIVRKRLQEIADAHDGRITANMVVEDAKRKQSPLHKFFDWNVKKAAERHWLDKAGELLRSVEIQVKTERTVIAIPAFTRDPSKAGNVRGMIAVPRLRDDVEMAREALVMEFRRAMDVLHRAHRLATALELEGEVESIIAKLTTLHDRVSRSEAVAMTA